MYPKETKSLSQRTICTPMFIAALFTTNSLGIKITQMFTEGKWIQKNMVYRQWNII